MRPAGRRLLGLAVLCGALPLAARCAEYPVKPITIVSEGVVGSIGDTAMRLIAKQMAEQLGQQVLIDNRPGAQGAIAAAAVKRSEPDGYTLFEGASSGLVISRFMVKNQAYDSLKDFVPISPLISTATYLVCRSSLPVHSLKELIAYAKANPGKLTYGSTGLGSPFHLWSEAFKAAAGVDMLHVPYNSGKASVFVNDLLADRLDVLFMSQTILRTQMKSGRITVLAANTSERSHFLPDVPTVNEVVPGYVLLPSLYALLGPLGMPRPIADRLAQELRVAEQQPQLSERMQQLGMIPLAGTPEDLTRELKRGIREIGALAKSIGLQRN